MKNEHTFVDTNILVYAHDISAGERHEVAKTLVRALWTSPYPPAISTQVLQELYVNLVRKKVDPDTASKLVESYFAWEVITIDPSLLSLSFAIHSSYKVSFWDSLVIAAAKRAGASTLLSEDLNSGQKYEGIFVRNPFKEK